MLGVTDSSQWEGRNSTDCSERGRLHKEFNKKAAVSEALTALAALARVAALAAAAAGVALAALATSAELHRLVAILSFWDREGRNSTECPKRAHLHKEFKKKTAVSEAPSNSHPGGGDGVDGRGRPPRKCG